MPDQLPEKPEEEKAEPKSAPEQKSPADQNPQISKIASSALPNLEPHIYKPETPAVTTAQTSTKTLETPAESSAPEQKPSPLEEDSIVAGEPLFEPEEKSKKKLYIIVAIIIIGLATVSVWIFMNFNKNKGAAEKKPETTQQQTSAPVVTEVKESEGTFDRSQISLEVLNGSGIAGAAKKVADSLSALEYQIVKVGNAQENSQTSQIFVSIDLEKFQGEFLKDLDGIVEEATISGKLEDSTASARIIIGKN